MAKYGVELPIAGWIYLEIDAESEEDAIEKALETSWRDDDIQELCTYKKLMTGNVVHVSKNKVSVRKIDEDGCEDISDLVPLLQQRLESFHNDMLQSCQCDEDRQLEKLDYKNYLTYLKLLENHQFNEAQRLFQEMDTQAREILVHILEEAIDQRQKQKQQKNKYKYKSTDPFGIMKEARLRYLNNPNSVDHRCEYEARRQDWVNFRDQHRAESRLEREVNSQTIDRER